MSNMLSEGWKSLDSYQRANEEFQMKKQLQQAQTMKAMQEAQGGGGTAPAAMQMANSYIRNLELSGKVVSPIEKNDILAQFSKTIDRGLMGSQQGGYSVAPGYAQAVGDIAATKGGMARQAVQNVNAATEPGIQSDVEAAKLGQQLIYKPKITAADSAANIAAKAEAEAKAGLPDFLARTENQLNVIDQMIGNPEKGMVEHPGLQGAVGGLDARMPSVSDKSLDFDALLEQAKGGAFLTSIGQLQGMGALSNAEGQTATIAATRMKAATSEAGFRKAAAEYREIMVKGMDRMKSKAGESASPDALEEIIPTGGKLTPAELAAKKADDYMANKAKQDGFKGKPKTQDFNNWK